VGLSVVLFVGPYAEIVKLDTSKIVTTWKLRGQWQENKKNKVALKGAWTGSYDPSFKFATAPTSQI